METVPSILLTTSFPPAVGGLETLLYQIARRLRPTPTVLAPIPAAAPDVRVHQVSTTPSSLAGRAAYRPLWALHPSLFYTWRYAAAALRATREQRPSIVQCGHVYLAPLSRMVARRLRVPFVVYVHGREVWRAGRCEGVGGLDRLLRGRALRDAAAVFVHGPFSANLVREWGVAPARIVQVPYGADPRPPLPAPSGHTLLSVSRLVPRKGIDTLIGCLPLLRRQGLHAELRIVGVGPYQSALQDLAASLGVQDHVHFLGRMDPDDPRLREEYRRCALFVLPARRTGDGELEGYGLVYLEAAAWGRAVVAGRSGGEADAVLHGVTGVLTDGHSRDAVAETVAGLLRDPDRLRTLGEAGRRRIMETHNWGRAAAVVAHTLDRASAVRG